MKRARAVIAAIAGHTLLVLLFPTSAWSSDRVSLREPTGGAERRLPSLDELPKEAAFEEFVRHAYADLVRWTAPSGKGLSIQVENFRHFPKEAFDTVHYTDVVTLPGGDTIVAARVRHRATWTDEVRVMYDPAWITRNPYLQTEEGEKAATLQLGAALEWATPDEARLAQLTGITSYDVTVSLEDKSRTYRAAFGWIDRDPSSSSISNVEAIFWDNVTVGVGETLAETAPLGSEIPSPRPPTNEPEADGIRRITAESSTCTAGVVGSLNGFLLFQSDRSGHSAGVSAFPASERWVASASQ